MGPHPAVATVRRAVRLALPDPSRPVLVACSGGADSLALAAATAFVTARTGQRAGLATVDHGLQPGSATQAARVAALGREWGFAPVEIVTVTVGRDGGPEAAARTARYAALTGLAEQLDADVLLGHTLDDQAETVLLGLGRGSGPRSIAGMRPVDGRFRRPLLDVRQATTAAACAALGLPVWDDPHNADPSYTRVRLRREVLPLLEDVLHGGVAEALARTAALVRADCDALDAVAGSALINSLSAALERASGRVDHPLGGHPPLPLADVAGLPDALRTRALRAWLGGTLSAERTAAVDALVTGWHGQGPIDLPGGRRVRRRSETLVVETAEPHDAAAPRQE